MMTVRPWGFLVIAKLLAAPAGICGAPAIASARDEPAICVVVPADERSSMAWSPSDYKCVEINGCPNNSIIIDPDTGAPKGCKASAGGCKGDCTLCSGSPESGTVCQMMEENTCSGSGGTISCGKKIKGTCGVGTIGGCACAAAGAPGTETCKISLCSG